MRDLGAEDYCCDLLDFAMPWEGLAVVLLAYLDASKRDGGTFCVSALAFGPERAKRAIHRWKGLWGDTPCHMTELHARKKGGPFADWTGEQAGQRLKDSVSIITSCASFVVAVSCDLAELDRLAPKEAAPNSKVLLGGLNNAYAVCSHLAMCSLAELAGDGTDIGYFFEAGDEFQAASQRFISLLATHPQTKSLYKYRSHTVLKKVDCRLFEAADIAAWEWAKHVERSQSGIDMRPSLRALLGDNDGVARKGETNLKSNAMRGWHSTGAPLEGYFKRIRDLGLLED